MTVIVATIITMILVIMIITPPVQVIAAEGEHKASRALRHAAEVIIDSPAALQVTMTIVVMTMMTFLQLRYLQTLNSISAENNSTIIFPVPIDIISEMMGKVDIIINIIIIIINIFIHHHHYLFCAD